MTSNITRAASGILLAISQNQNADTLLQELQNGLNNLECPYPCLEELISQMYKASSQTQTPILKILEAELLLFFTPHQINHSAVESIFKELSYLSTTNTLSSGSSTALTRIKYNDLVMDYQLLYSPRAKQLRLVDLVSKKINILSLRPDTGEKTIPSQTGNSVICHIRHKILIYHLLCAFDYRTQGVMKFLTDEGVLSSSLSPELHQFISRKRQLMKSDEFEATIKNIKRSFYPLHALSEKHLTQLVENHVDTNLSMLPKYYDTISLSRIRFLLLPQENKIDIESLLFKLISANKFNMEVRIDQTSGYVHFVRRPQLYGEFETHIKRVCDMVESISFSIEESTMKVDS